MLRFIHGEELELEFPTEPYPLGLLATIGVYGRVLALDDLVLYVRGADHAALGVRQMVEVRRSLARAAEEAGFEEVVFSGRRLSGSNPGHSVISRMKLKGR